MAGTDTFEGSIAAADARVDAEGKNPYDDKLDAEEHAAFLWLRAHHVPGDASFRVVLKTEPLSDAWKARAKNFFDENSARSYIHKFERSAVAMHELERLARSLNSALPGKMTRAQVIAAIANDLTSPPRVWALEFTKSKGGPASRFVSKTTPSVLAPLNPRYGTQIDFNFISGVEGDQWLRGYVPIRKDKVVGASGMTIGTGFDIAQWDEAQLNKLGLSAAILNKIRPFLSPNNFKGMSRAAVIAAVGTMGPVPELKQDQADSCDAIIFGRKIVEARSEWNGSADAGVPQYTTLPGVWQTVWFSRVYQEGRNAKDSKAIAFRDAATSGEWKKAIGILQNYTADYVQRGTQEANLLLSQPLPAAVEPPKPKPAK